VIKTDTIAQDIACLLFFIVLQSSMGWEHRRKDRRRKNTRRKDEIGKERRWERNHSIEFH
jgi:hypothetical protein